MKIKYLSCDGETEVEEEIISIEFYEYKHPMFKDLVQAMECIRPEGDTFVVDCKNVFEITQ